MANTQDVTPRNDAPRALSVYPAWSCAKKDAIGKALGTSRLWFTLAQGIVTEVYFPRPDIPQLKDLGFIIADNAGFWVELRRMNQYSVSWHEDVIPAITLTHRHERFTFTLRICVDPDRDVLLLDFSLEGEPGLYPYVLAAPRLGENATSNLALAADWEGHPTLWVEQGPFGLALMATNRQNRTAFMERSVGEVGVSDGWQDFNQNGRMNWHYAKAGPSDVALTAKLSRSGTLALGLGSSKEAAATLALQSLAAGFESRWTGYTQSWKSWLDGIHLPALLQKLDKASRLLIFRSAVVIKSHEDATFPGACVASLSVPWGESSVSRGGYHLVWSRDLVETAGALIALGCLNEARRILLYLMATQQANGHWLQNQWLGGKPFWQGIQLDETAFPVLLASALAEQDALEGIDVTHMTRQALRFIAQEGPTTSQDRWEEDAGINTFTLAAAISALVEGSRFLKGKEAECALMLADSWNSQLEKWTWASDTALSRKLGIDGYYMRCAPTDTLIHDGARHEALLIKNRAQDPGLKADEQLAGDCLQLARYGLRLATDPALMSSIQGIDTLLKTDTPNGPVWHRYNGDGYGEHRDGSPFDGCGRGRGWPLLTGERGHFALLAGENARPYLRAMTRMTGPGGLLPEQVWDSDPIPEHDLFPGQPSGSAMPLVWAHAEYIKLALSLASKAPVDRPARTFARYGGKKPVLDYALWQPKVQLHELAQGQALRFLLPEPALVHWGKNGWKTIQDEPTQDWGLGHVAILATSGFSRGTTIEFTFYWPQSNTWQQEDFQINIT